jgi:hypothetical protein
MSEMRYILIILILMLFCPKSKADELCNTVVDGSLKYPKQNSNLSSQDGYRLAAIIRNQAENILHAKTKGKMNLLWNESSNQYFSSYTTKESGSKIDLIFDEHSMILAYKITTGATPKYHCSEQFVSDSSSAKKVRNGKRK